MKRLLICALICATPAFAEGGPTYAQMAKLVALIDARGCVIYDKNDAKLLQDSGLTPDEAGAAVRQLIDEGTAEIRNDQLHLLTPACKAAPAPSGAAGVADRPALIALIEANGCKMTEPEAEKILPNAGFTKDSAREIVDTLVSEGQADVGEFGIILKTGNCS